LIKQCLPIPQKLYNITTRLKTKEEIEEYFPGLLVFIDSTEQPIPRPAKKKYRKKRRLYYSGKKKKHTVKNLYAVNQKGWLIYKTKNKQRGRKHDYNVYKNNRPADIPKEVLNMLDLGFFGVEEDYPEQRSSLPIKKEKGRELTVEQKEYNKNHSAKRIIIEHVFARLKKYKIMNDVFRNKLRRYDRISSIVAGLVNYRIMNAC
jgi:hypothetical protein